MSNANSNLCPLSASTRILSFDAIRLDNEKIAANEVGLVLSPLGLCLNYSQVAVCTKNATWEEFRKSLQFPSDISASTLCSIAGSLQQRIQAYCKRSNNDIQIENNLWVGASATLEIECSVKLKTQFKTSVNKELSPIGIVCANQYQSFLINCNKIKPEEAKLLVSKHFDSLGKTISTTNSTGIGLWSSTTISFVPRFAPSCNFEVFNTRLERWYGGNESECCLMYQRGEYEYVKTEEFEAVELELGCEGWTDLRIRVFLPVSDDQSAEKVIPNAKRFANMKDEFRKREGQIWLPRFSLTTILTNHKELAGSIGINQAFDINSGDFSGLIDRRYCTEKAWLQQATTLMNLTVNEDPAQKNGERPKIQATGLPCFEMKCDRPFAVVIYQKDRSRGDVIIATAAILSPGIIGKTPEKGGSLSLPPRIRSVQPSAEAKKLESSPSVSASEMPRSSLGQTSHAGIVCQNTSCPLKLRGISHIVGIRYKCSVCPNSDYCQSCAFIPGIHNPSHLFLVIENSDRHRSSTISRTKARWIHAGYACNGCNQDPIVGIRYQCTMCGVNLCAACDSNWQLHPLDHTVLRINVPQQPQLNKEAVWGLTTPSPQNESKDDIKETKQISPADAKEREGVVAADDSKYRQNDDLPDVNNNQWTPVASTPVKTNQESPKEKYSAASDDDDDLWSESDSD